MKRYPLRGEIYWVNLDPTVGSEVTKTRPCLIVSNDAGNEDSSRVIVAPITSSVKKVFPFEVPIKVKDKQGKIMLDQIRSIDKQRLGSKLGYADEDAMELVDEALKLVLSLD